MNHLQIHDLHQCVKRLPKPLMEYLKLHPIIVAGVYSCGIISGEKPSAVDLFAGDKRVSRIHVLHLAKDVKKVYETDNAFTIKVQYMPVQFIHRWVFDTPISLISSFDFTICQAAFWWDKDTNKWDSTCSLNFYPDLAAKRLIYTWPVREEEAGGSMLRILKYYQKGYRVPLDSFAAVIARLMKGVRWNVILNRFSVHHEVILSEEELIHLASILAGLLFEVDPNGFIDHEAYLPKVEELINYEEPEKEEILT